MADGSAESTKFRSEIDTRASFSKKVAPILVGIFLLFGLKGMANKAWEDTQFSSAFLHGLLAIFDKFRHSKCERKRTKL